MHLLSDDGSYWSDDGREDPAKLDWNNNIFSSGRTLINLAVIIKAAKLFHALATAPEKTRFPSVERQVGGMTSVSGSPDRRWQRSPTSTMCCVDCLRGLEEQYHAHIDKSEHTDEI